MDWRTLLVLLATPALLTVFFYFGRPGFFNSALREWAHSVYGWEWEYFELLPYVYWVVACMIIRVIIPILLIVVVMRNRISDYGFRIRGSARHIPIYFVLYIAILPLLYWASTRGSFQDKYPFYRDAILGGWHFWGYEALYFIQFFALEAFFRGFLLFGLARRFGYYSVVIMTIPYCMIHFNKPLSETLGAIFAGMILGVLALRTKSFYWGVLLHFAVAITMDLLALYRMSSP